MLMERIKSQKLVDPVEFEEKTEQYRNELANYIKNVKTDLILIMLGIGAITMIACGFIVCIVMGKI